MKRTKITDQLRDKAIELRKNGIAITKIAIELNVAHATICNIVKNIILTEEQKCKLHYRESKHLLKYGGRKIGSITKRRKEMGEDEWLNYQIERKIKCKNKQDAEYWSNKRFIKKKIFVEYKGGKCIKCGYNKCLAALDFHHRDPKTKRYAVSKLYSISLKRLSEIEEELDKCDLLCRNCHAESHYELNNKNRKMSV